MSGRNIIIIDESNQWVQELHTVLRFLGFSTDQTEVSSLDQTVPDFKNSLCCILTSFNGKNDWINILKKLQSYTKKIPFLVVSDKAIDIEQADIIFDQIHYPLKQSQLLHILHRCQAHTQQSIQNISLEITDALVGNSQAIQKVRKMVSQAANSDVNVLILGESGSGKEVVAKCLHQGSKRKDHPFVPVNCGAIPGELLESELFGHEKGAFTGAYSARKGRFELAQGGTIFLDEIGDMPLAMQVKLLRVLQEKYFERVGSNKSIETNVRVIAATHCNLEKAIENNEFREDLYYRLNVFPIEMPALRQRIEDLPIILNDLVIQLSQQQERTIKFTEQAIKVLSQYHWPGNVRELANLVERLMVLLPNGIVGVDDLPAKYRGKQNEETSQEVNEERVTSNTFSNNLSFIDSGIDLKKHLTDLELTYIKKALEQCDGVVVKAAEYLNMRRTTLVEKMRKYGIKRTDVQSVEEFA